MRPGRPLLPPPAPPLQHTGRPDRGGDERDSEVVSSAADRVTHHAEQCQDGPGHQDNDADRPDNSDFRDETDDEKNYAEDDQRRLLVVGR
jgi:hypothetical protein